MQATSPTKAAATPAADIQAEAAPVIESIPADTQAAAATVETVTETKDAPETSAKTTDQATSPKADKPDGEKKPRRERRPRRNSKKENGDKKEYSEKRDDKDKKETTGNRPQR